MVAHNSSTSCLRSMATSKLGYCYFDFHWLAKKHGHLKDRLFVTDFITSFLKLLYALHFKTIVFFVLEDICFAL